MQLQTDAREHAAGRIALADGATVLSAQAWARVDPANIVESWTAELPTVTAATTRAQYAAARTADPYVDEFDLGGAGVEDNLDPTAFAGTASDGRGLVGLLMSPAFQALQFIGAGLLAPDAMRVGGQHLDTIVRTQVADAGRLADGVALTAHRRIDGYIRVVAGGACSRCVVLAGKWYRWNEGFLRHPNCHCVHAPSAREVDPQDPKRLYDAMTPAQRKASGWSAADQAAIADGADIAQVTNAHRSVYTAGGKRYTREGTTRRGLFGGYRIDPDTGALTRRPRGERAPKRLTPEQIYRQAGEDRDAAVRLLRQNGYLKPVTAPAPRVPARTGARANAPAGKAGAGGGEVLPVRQVLRDAATVPDIEMALAAEVERITGRSIPVDLAGSAEEVAREHAEGVLLVLERYPRAKVNRVEMFDSGAEQRFAEADPDLGSVRFSLEYATDHRAYMEVIRKNGLQADGLRGGVATSPVGVAIHEVGHIVDLGMTRGAIHDDVYALAGRLADEAGMAHDPELFVKQQLSMYGARDAEETIGEALADVFTHGADASALSRGVVDLLDAAYEDRGFGEVFRTGARALGPALERMTVVQLRALAREQGVRIPSGSRKADIVRLLQGGADTRPFPTFGEQMTIRQAQARQADIDARRAVAESVGEIMQLLNDEASPAALRHRIGTTARRVELPPRLVKSLLAKVDDPEALKRAALAAARRAGLKPTALPGGRAVRFDRALHQSIGGSIRDGQRVEVIRPGFEATLANGEKIIIEKAKVQIWEPGPIPDLTGLPKPPGVGPLPNRAGRSIDEIIRDTPDLQALPWEQREPLIADLRAEVQKALNAEYGSLAYEVKVNDVAVFGGDTMIFSGTIHNADGKTIGRFSRNIGRDRAGDLYAEHVLMAVGRKAQGSGFAQEFNRNLYDWYRRSGIKYVSTHANIDVGGYTWAAQGFDFGLTTPDIYLRVARVKVNAALRRTPKALTKEQVRALDQYLRELEEGRLPISAPALSQFGREPGQGGRDAMWPGKWLMLRTDWYGRLYL